MILVDDHLARAALSGRRWPARGIQTPVLPWTLHVRLLRALIDSNTLGRLSRGADADIIGAALSPPPDTLRILDPRPYSVATASLMADHKVSLAAAELLAAALERTATIHLAEANVGRKWGQTLDGTGVTLVTYNWDELASS
ncbi:MAG: hypothetical protein OXG69_02065 [bacterium]|nr:hypothetical protein [bacterium]